MGLLYGCANETRLWANAGERIRVSLAGSDTNGKRVVKREAEA